MVLFDVNVLIYAFHRRAADHHRYCAWLDSVIDGDGAYGVVDLVCSGFLRIVTNPRIFAAPATLDDALSFVERVRQPAHCVVVAPGTRHWDIFTRLCRSAGVRGNLVPDAYLAALAIESGSEWITTDRDYARFPGLRWRHPLEE
jgi:hypothetical protein